MKEDVDKEVEEVKSESSHWPCFIMAVIWCAITFWGGYGVRGLTLENDHIICPSCRSITPYDLYSLKILRNATELEQYRVKQIYERRN